jgi:hypothetical protein
VNESQLLPELVVAKKEKSANEKECIVNQKSLHHEGNIPLKKNNAGQEQHKNDC